MIQGLNNIGIAKTLESGKSAAGGGFGWIFRGEQLCGYAQKSIDDVSKLQQDASQAVTDLATGKTENVSGVMTAVEKSDLAFKTLLAIRSKLMDAYDEIKGMSV